MVQSRYFGDWSFYKKVATVAFPVMIQSMVGALVGLLDNLMVGQLGDAAVSGVAVASQIIFILMISVIGSTAGAGIYLSQFHGAKDIPNVRQTFRAKIIFAAAIMAVAFIVFLFLGRPIISLFLTSSVAIEQGVTYLQILTFAIIPFGMGLVYSVSFREVGLTHYPMISGLVGIVVNFVGNLILIFGWGPIPAMGVAGAAIATVIARWVEFLVIFVIAHRVAKVDFAVDVYKSFNVSPKLMKKVLIKALPLFANEILWSTGITVIMAYNAMRGDHVVAALSITNTIANIMYTAFGGLAAAIAAMVGAKLGANQLQEAEDNAYRMIVFGVMVSIFFSIIVYVLTLFVPDFYQVSEGVKDLARQFLYILCFAFVLFTINVCIFFTLRSGGNTWVTLAFDSAFMWVVPVPLTIVLILFTPMNIFWIYLIIQAADLVKTIFGLILMKRRTWIRNLAHEEGTTHEELGIA